MVMKGQFLERPSLIPLGNGLVLEAIAHRGERDPGVLVVPPPPAEGSGMDHVAGAEIAFAVSQAGHQCLRFNFRGVGASQGRIDSASLLEDALAAWELARDNAEGVAPVLVTLGGADVVGRSLVEQVPVAGWALIHPNLMPFETSLALSVVMPELDPVERRRAWAARLEPWQLSLVAGSDRAYHRNLPQVGKAVVALLQRVGTL